MTPAELKALIWFEVNGPVALFDAKAPSSSIRRKLLAVGLIETCGTEAGHGAFGFTKFRLSQLGRSALALT